MPFIAAWAREDMHNKWQKKLPIKAGAIQSQIANVTDIFPTLLELINAKQSLPSNHKIDGVSFRSLLTGNKDSNRPEKFLMHYPHAVHRSNYFTTWRDGDWKVIYHTLPNVLTTGRRLQFEEGHYELFNLKNDPFESANLAIKKPAKLRSMMQGLISELESMNALYPIDTNSDELRPELP